jgi:hypothetical protein
MDFCTPNKQHSFNIATSTPTGRYEISAAGYNFSVGEQIEERVRRHDFVSFSHQPTFAKFL